MDQAEKTEDAQPEFCGLTFGISDDDFPEINFDAFANKSS